MIPVLTLLLVLYLSLFITRLATIALEHTGVSTQTARFQARSALSGCGYTTSEAEKMVTHPVRRKILMILMLLGNVGVVAALSATILGFMKFGEGTESLYVKLIILISGLFFLLYASKSKIVDKFLSRVFGWILHKYFKDIELLDYDHLFHLADDYKITEVNVRPADWVENKQLKQTKLSDEGIVLLGIQRSTGDYIGAPVGSTKINVDDTLIVYGKNDLIHALKLRKAGILGDNEHIEAIGEHKKVIKAQKK